MKKIIIVALITSLFLAYLFQHRYSLKCTQELAQLDKNRQLLKEEITRLQTEQARTFLFVNLENNAEKLGLVFSKKRINYLSNNTAPVNPGNFTDTLAVAHKTNPNQPIHHE